MKGASNEVMMTIRNTGANSVSNRLAIKGATTPVEIPDNNSTGMANSGITSKATQYKTAGRTANLNSTRIHSVLMDPRDVSKSDSKLILKKLRNISNIMKYNG